MKIDRDKAIEMILSTHKNFLPKWNEHLDFWEEDNPGITNDFSPYVDYVMELIINQNIEELMISAELIENFINNGDKNVQYGAEIGFLEGITNTLSHGEKEYILLFTEQLLPKSLEFCKALDEFWGTKTAGL